MVLDTSALVAILLGEEEGERFIDLLAAAEDVMISAATLLEASIVMLAKTGDDGVGDLDDLLAAAGVRSVAVDASQVRIARSAYRSYGRGRSPAQLTFGDCFAYALARQTGRPLLFKGEDFRHTDIVAADA